jgi:hypothetical protein
MWCEQKIRFLAITIGAAAMVANAIPFEGEIAAEIKQGNETNALLYTVGTNFLRVEMTATNWPNPVDILNLKSGALTLLYPHNRSFVRLKPSTENSTAPPGFPGMPAGVPPGIGPQTQTPPSPSGRIGPANFPGMPAPPQMPVRPQPPAGAPPGIGPQSGNAPGGPQMPNLPQMPGAGGMPARPMMPPPMMEKIELKVTDDKTNLLGFACEKFEIKQRGEKMEIWATDKLFPFQAYQQNQPHRFGPRMIEEQWAGLLAEKHLFPLLAVLKFDNGAERLRFEVQSVRPQKLTDEDAKLFQPPTNYFEIQPLPF